MVNWIHAEALFSHYLINCSNTLWVLLDIISIYNNICNINLHNTQLCCIRCAGYLCQKVGKVAATAVGGGLLLLQVFSHKTQTVL